MANPEHVEIVKKGRDAIAAWRGKYPGVRLDLRGADLTNANLTAANLRGANLVDAELCSADLVLADVSSADLVRANLRSADLTGVNLSFANLRGAFLYGAKLHNAILDLADLRETVWVEAKISGTRLIGSDFDGAIADHTIFADVDLSEVMNLETVTHRSPSTVGVDSLFRSKGNIPDAFLRGCGVPEELIIQLPAIIGSMQPIQFYSCFLSHSSKDDAFSRRLHARLTAEKLRVWFAPEDMRGGKKSRAQIDEAIRVYDRLLLVLSEESMKSEWVRHEIKRARQKERDTGREVLFPIGLVPHSEIKKWECLDSDTGEDLAEKVREYHIPNFSNWKLEDDFEKAFADLMRDLRREDEKRSREEQKNV